MVDVEKPGSNPTPEETPAEGSEAVVEAAGHEDHGDPPYFIIWFVLLVLTLAEVGYAFLSLPQFWLSFGLIVMAFWKAALVALYYMHLRWEPRRLWVLAASPLPLVAILIIAVLTEY